MTTISTEEVLLLKMYGLDAAEAGTSFRFVAEYLDLSVAALPMDGDRKALAFAIVDAAVAAGCSFARIQEAFSLEG